MKDFFPFTVWWCDWGTYVASPQDFRAVYDRVRPAQESWYAYAVIVHSPTKITFVVYGMEDNYHGGVGQEIRRISTTVMPEVTLNSITAQARDKAKERRTLELARNEEAIVDGYVQEILASIPVDA